MAAKTLKTIYHVPTERWGEYDFFFNAKGKYLDCWHSNDANWRGEYMRPLLKKLGYVVEEGKDTDPRFFPEIKKTLISHGCDPSELEGILK